MTKKVLIIQRRMTEFRVPMFEALRKRLAEHGVILAVAYGTPTVNETSRNDAGILPWGIKTPNRYLFSSTSHLVWQSIPRALLAEQDLIIIPHENMLLANYLLLFQRWSRRRHMGLAFWGHGANFQSLDQNGIRERVRAWTARQVDWWFAYTELSVKKVLEGGRFPAERITCLNNAFDIESLQRWRKEITPIEQKTLLGELGLRGEQLAIFIGALYQGKRLNFLFAAADSIRRRLPDFELLIVGDGPQRELVREFCASRPWCRSAGARYGRDKALYSSLGQVLLNPGLVGLNILDSFALGIPLITTDCGIHSPEIAYLESGRNGFMVEDDLEAYTAAVMRVLTDGGLREEIARNCLEYADRYSLENMVENFCTGILRATSASMETESAVGSGRHVVIIWQRFLPYHKARIRRLHERLALLGYRLTAIEVASQDATYGFSNSSVCESFEQICCFPGSSYHEHSAYEIHGRVVKALVSLRPDLVFAPATPFPEGMAADAYRQKSGCRRIMMDDSWEHTDRREWFTRAIKRLIHSNIDGVFVPASSHRPYFESMGFPGVRVFFGVDVVDNDFYAGAADRGRLDAGALRDSMGLPDKYFLFVGRFLPRKGLEMLLVAYKRYREEAGAKAWDLVLVGGGPHLENIQALAAGSGGVHFAGLAHGEDLCRYYGLAQALIVPSLIDQWGLVVNEGMAAGLPVLVSSGCGSARILVQGGENGWIFEPDEKGVFMADAMSRLSALSGEALQAMGRRSREIIADWSLDRFSDGAIEALSVERRPSGGLLANLVIRLWKGRISVN